MSRGIAAKGRSEIERHRNGKAITRNQAIRAKCYDCMGGYSDGKVDCRMPACPLYPWMPYKNEGLTPS